MVTIGVSMGQHWLPCPKMEKRVQVFVLMTPPLFHPNFECSCWTRSPTLGSTRAETL